MKKPLKAKEDSNKFISDGSGMTTTQCFSCIHLKPGSSWKCPAFPKKEIPTEIVMNDFDHREKYPGDHGVRFEAKEDAPKPYLKSLYAVLDEVKPHDDTEKSQTIDDDDEDEGDDDEDESDEDEDESDEDEVNDKDK